VNWRRRFPGDRTQRSEYGLAFRAERSRGGAHEPYGVAAVDDPALNRCATRFMRLARDSPSWPGDAGSGRGRSGGAVQRGVPLGEPRESRIRSATRPRLRCDHVRNRRR
jgi:hypothetical protein